MSKPEFDQYATQYDEMLADALPGVSEEENRYFAEYKIALMHRLLANTTPQRILDFGCGAGRSLPYLDRYFPNAELWGYDVSPASLQIAAQRVPRAKLFSEWAGIGETRFDAIIAANVFHHIPPEQHAATLAQCHKALLPGGSLILFEHNPYNPATRWIFERCPFDVDAKMLNLHSTLMLSHDARFATERHGYTLFFPRPLALLRPLERWLKWLPLGAQYYVQMTR